MPDTTDATARAVKLNRTQEALLRCAVRDGGQRCSKHYRSATKLKELGLVSIEEVPPPYAWIVRATAAGRAHPAARPRPDAATD